MAIIIRKALLENISFLSFQNRFFGTIKTIFDLIIALKYDIINDRNDKIDKNGKEASL